jgi:hypothetical protein
MWAWPKTRQRMLATSATAFAIVATCWQLRLPHRRALEATTGQPRLLVLD